jgi:hypothetical protein
MVLSGEGLVEFRSFERSWSWIYARVYKHVTLNGVKPQQTY